MPRTADQNLALREASRKRILDAAIKRFSRQGYASTSIRDIAREAGLAQGLLYSHFRGKEDLLRALFRRSMDDVRESFAAPAAAAPQEEMPPLERLIRSGLSILRRNLDFWRLSYGVRMQESVVKALGPDLQAWTRDILRTLVGIFRSSGSEAPGIDAALFFAAFDGVCQHYVLDPERYPLDKVAGALIARFTPAAPADRRAGKPGPSRTRSSPKSNKGASHGKSGRRR